MLYCEREEKIGNREVKKRTWPDSFVVKENLARFICSLGRRAVYV